MQILIAVYGTLRKGYWNHSLIEKTRFIGKTKTGPNWKMYISTGQFPVLVPGSTSVLVEVYDVSRETLARVDMLEGYPDFYNRKLIHTEYGDAWIYFMQNYKSGIEIKSGDYTDYFNSFLNSSTVFDQEEFDE